jgi:hypothetical protein
MGVKECRKKAEDISARAVIMKEAIVKLEGLYANEEKC